MQKGQNWAKVCPNIDEDEKSNWISAGRVTAPWAGGLAAGAGGGVGGGVAGAGAGPGLWGRRTSPPA